MTTRAKAAVAVEEAGDPDGEIGTASAEFDPSERVSFQHAEDRHRQRMKAEPKVERFYVPFRATEYFKVIINGVSVTVPFRRKVMLPLSVALLADAAEAEHMKDGGKTTFHTVTLPSTGRMPNG